MLPFLFPAAIVFILDRFTKLRVMKTMAVGESFRVIGNFFRITSVRNTGAAFGMFAGNHRVFVVISLVAIVAVLALQFRIGRGHALRSVALGLILGGAAGNVYDRIMYREVVDFLQFSAGRWSFAVFNIADSAVTVGVALLALETYVQGKPRPEEPAALPTPPEGGGGV